MITIGIDPILVSYGHFIVRWYGIIVATAILAALWLGGREAQRRGLDAGEFSSLAMWAIPVGLVGARLFHVLDHWGDIYAANPVRALYIWEGGLAVWGAVIGGLIAFALWAWRRKRNLGVLLDSAAPGAVLGQAIGRLACVITGDAMGRVTIGPIGFAYSNPSAMVSQLGFYYTPTPVFEIILNVSIFALLWRLRRRTLPSGGLFLIYMALYSVGRFIITFWSSYQTVAFGLNQAQLISAGSFVIALPWLILLLRRNPGLARADGR